MTLNNLIQQIFIVLTIVSAMVSFSNVQAEPFNLKPLSNIERNYRIDGVEQESSPRPTVTMLFQPNCSWCKKQGEILAKAFEQCQNAINITLVGVKGSMTELKREVSHYHNEIPSFLANRRYLKEIGGFEASPTTLIYSANGELLTKKRGFIPYNNLSKVLAIISQGDCKI